MNFRKVLPLSLLALAALLPDAGAQLAARHSHTTTILPDGNILITGGVSDAGATRIPGIQMYNMATNTFQAWAGNLNTARSSHTATVMSDGRVLIAGGFTNAANNPPTADLEICNPIARTCLDTAVNMSAARGGHTATLLTKGPNAGKVLICGGQSAAAATSVTDTCDLFDPAANPPNGAITAATPMVSPRMGHAAVLLKSGNVFVTGGRRRNQAGTAWIYEPTNEMYDVGISSWTPKDALLQGRIDHSATVLNNGLVLIAGGFNTVNTRKCVDNEGEECWSPEDEDAWGYQGLAPDGTDIGPYLQGWGSHGYLDGAELFDQNGGRMVLSESTFGTAPYRFHQHSSVLQPDGVWNMQGGYGGIVRTLFDNSPELEEDSVIFTGAPRTVNSATIVPGTSQINFPLEFVLSRFVSGRIVSGNIYFARNTEPTDPAISLDEASIYLDHSTASVDGLPVGTTIDADHNPGDFDSIVSLSNPAGRVDFDPVNLTSDASSDQLNLDITAYNLTFPAVNPIDSTDPNSPQPITGGSIDTTIAVTLPCVYNHINGSVDFATGQITDPDEQVAITIEDAGTDTFTDLTPVAQNGDTCIFHAAVTIPNISGSITNLSAIMDGGNTIQNNAQVDPDTDGILSISYTLNFTANEIRPGALQPALSYSRSNIVISSMIFSSALAYTPSANTWKDLSDTDISPTLSQPVFNHTAVLTPSADTVVLGGRNCETSPATNCRNRVFSPTAFYSVFVPVYRNSDGSDAALKGEKLASPRAFHTSTLLLNGDVLTCGGSDGVRPLATCELLDAATRKWAATGAMKYARARHTATLLPNGNVLVAGGATPSSAAVNTAEIYYPASRTWVQTTSMFETRQNHTATLLPDGNVLVAGGATQSTYTATAEVFISSNSYWVRGPSLPAYAMGTPRAQHTATLLRNGNVMMAGGVNGFGAVDTTEFFNYRNMQFTAGPAMTIGRYGHSANLLRDGRVILLGGSDNSISGYTGEIYSPATGVWNNTGLLFTYSRTGHRSVLLPNGKLLVTGGEDAGTVRSYAEGFDPDWLAFTPQGTTDPRAYHTSVVLPDNYILNIGGWDGARYLDTTDLLYFSYFPDVDGREADPARNPLISTGTVLFDRGDRLTLQSGTTNFHGFTEASGGGAGPMSSSQSNPRVYMQQIDNPSGYMIDMSTYIYSLYGGLYSTATWETSLSSITIVTPQAPWDLPHGWYHVRVANNAQFSPGFTVQVTTPRPTGLATEPAPVAGSIGLSSITWNWTSGTIAAAEGYSLYAASNSVFITTMAFVSPANYTQTGLSPNTAASVMVSAYNLGGYGPLAKSATYYTLAATPSTLTVTSASFETVSLHWYPNGNTPVTQYEVSMSPDNFVDPLSISTPVPFSVNHVSTATTINQLSADQVYFFRVRARNGDGVPTGFNTDIDPAVSTITVSGITNLTGSPFSATAINWAWDDIEETGIYYEVYDVTTGSQTFVSSATTNYPFFTQEGLLPNTQHIVTVNAAKNVPGVGPVRGPKALSRAVFTRTVQLLPATPNIFTNVSTGSFVASWITNGNPDGTAYGLFISTHADFVEYSSATTTDNPVSGGLSYNFTGLEPNVRYYVRVNAVNGDGQTGSTLDLGSRYTLANPPARVIPLEVTMSGVTLGWDTAGNSSATIYEVRGTTENFTLSVTTYVPFAALYDQNYARLTGLLTATTYYFDVAARNGDGRVTSRIQAYYDGVDEPGIYTLPGPGTSPPGSVGGTSAVNAASTISGTLPDGRPVSLYIPAGAFPATTAIAISSSATNPCSYLVGGRPIEVAIYSENDAQPLEPVTLTLYYNSAESNAAIDANRNRMVIARYNPVSGQCLPLETRIDPGPRTITATLNHFSVFQLIVRSASAGLSDVLIYPNPFYTNRGNGFVTIANIPAAAKVRVYTLSGEKVWDGTAGNTGLIIWRGVNKSGELVASGIYLAVIDSSAGKKVVKIAVER